MNLGKAFVPRRRLQRLGRSGHTRRLALAEPSVPPVAEPCHKLPDSANITHDNYPPVNTLLSGFLNFASTVATASPRASCLTADGFLPPRPRCPGSHPCHRRGRAARQRHRTGVSPLPPDAVPPTRPAG